MTIIYFIFIFFFITQLFFFLFFFLRLAFYIDKPFENKTESNISVIVCAHNEIHNLKKLIPLLLSQNFANYEVIIVDDRSEDGTSEYFSNLYSEESKFRILRIKETPIGINSKKHALSHAIHASNNEIILLTDADCMPCSANWIKEMVSGIDGEKKIVLGYSPYEEKPGILNLMIQYETIYTAIQYFSLALAGFPYMGVGRNMAYKKEVFIKNKGLQSHKGIIGGDDDLFIREVANKKNTLIRINKSSQVLSIPKTTFKSWFIQKRRHLSVGRMYKWNHKLILGILMLSHIVFYLSFFVLAYNSITEVFIYLMLRSIVFVLIFTLIAEKLGSNIKWYSLIMLDFFYILNYSLVSLSVILSKRIKWN